MEEFERLTDDALRSVRDAQAETGMSFGLPLYGLARPLDGGRSVEGPTASRRVDPGTGATIASTLECALVHGSPDPDGGPYVRVITTTDPDATPPWRLVVRVEPTPFEERIQAIADADYTPPGAARSVVDVPIDGRPVGFEVLRRGEHLVARHRGADHDIVLEGRGVDPAALTLVTVTDLRPYLDGLAGGR